MFNVTVFKLKDILKYIKIIVILIILIVIINYLSKKSSNTNVIDNNEYNLEETVEEIEIEVNETTTIAEEENIENNDRETTDIKNNDIFTNILIASITNTIPYSAIFTNNNQEKIIDTTIEEDNKSASSSILVNILKSQIGLISVIENSDDNSLVNNDLTISDTLDEDIEMQDDNIENTDVTEGKLTYANSTAVTEVITENPFTENYNTTHSTVKINNQTDYTLTEEMLTPNIAIDNKNILIFHTHTCESYTMSYENQFVESGTFRTTDLNYSVAMVGTELTKYLTSYGYNVLHNQNYHDYPAYSGSYNKSLVTVETELLTFDSDIIIDIHRDAVGSSTDYAPTVRIDEDECAQLMFVIGTNAGGLTHDEWNQNLKFAILVQETANQMYPGLFKPMLLTTSRYNQHTGSYANIIEVGATGNSIEEATLSMKYLSAVLDVVLSNN